MSKQIKTTCPRDCYDACGMIATIERGKIIELKGDSTHPVTQGFLCPRGNKDIQRMMTNRVEQPFVRLQNNNLQKTDWNTALNLISSKIKEIIKNHGAEKILYLDYAGNEGLYNNYFAKRFWYELGASFSDGSLCTASGHKSLKLHYGLSYGVLPDELPQKDLIVFWGFNPAVTAPHFWKLALKARKQNNAKIVVIDVLKTITAKKADLFVQLYPGTDTALAFAVMKYLIDNQKVNIDFINKFTTGFDELKKTAQEWNIPKTADFCEISQSEINQLAELYAQSKNSATMIGVGVQKRAAGSNSVRAISMIPALLGIHRGFFFANSRGNFVDTDTIEGKKQVDFLSQTQIAKEIENHGIKMVFINSTNPLVTHPDAGRLRELFCSKDIFVVVNETHWSETAQKADVVLPVPTFLEKDDVMLSWGHNYTRYSERAVKPITNAKTEVEISVELAKLLDFPSDIGVFENPAEVVQKAFENAIETGKLFDKQNNLVTLKYRPRNEYQTPSGKIEFYSSLAEKEGLNPLPVQSEKEVKNGSFILITSASALHTNSQFTEIYGKNKPELHINPADAEKLNLQDGDKILLENENGRLLLKTKISEIPRQGVVWMPRFVEDIFGTPVNAITSRGKQKIGGSPVFHSTFVEIRKKS